LVNKLLFYIRNRKCGSIMMLQTRTLAKRSVIYSVALLATVAIQKD